MVLRQAVKSGVALLVCAAFLYGCDFYPIRSKNGDLSDMQDRQQELTRQDFRDLNKQKKLLSKADQYVVNAQVGTPPIPDLAQVLAAPRPPKVANAKLVTLSVTDDVPLRDVLFELGRLANVDIEVGSGLDTQGINLRATDRPFNEVIERIANLGGLRYSVNGNAIRVERDVAYIKNYNLDFINITRSSSNNYNLSTSILSSGSGGGSGGSTAGNVGTSGSSSSISATSESDLWSSLEASVSEILNYMPQGNNAVQGASTEGGAAAATGGAAAGATGTTSAGFVINRQAGVLSVNGTERQHEMIQRFLTMLTRNASAQVLIEAKIVEVSLSDQFLSGVDWNNIIGSNGGLFASPGSYLPDGLAVVTGGTLNADRNSFAFGLNSGADLDAIIQLTEQYGTTRTLSSPRLSAINNQQAVLTFARNEVFFECEVTPATVISSTSSSQSTPGTADCTPQSVPIGIILNILPSINMDSQEVTLSVRPTLTRKVGDALNPEQDIINALNGVTDAPAVQQTTPIIEVRELDSVMKVKSGGVMVIGGLMEDTSTTANSGIPGMSDLPIIGSAFKSRNEDYSKRELIIFIKATIVNSDGSTHPVDRAVYDRFTTDPRPLFPKQYDAQ